MILTLAQAQDVSTSSTWAEVVQPLFDGPTVMFLLIFSIPIIAIAGGILKSILADRGVQRTRQEIAAYVAEGSMTAEEGERLLKAGPPKGDDE